MRSAVRVAYTEPMRLTRIEPRLGDDLLRGVIILSWRRVACWRCCVSRATSDRISVQVVTGFRHCTPVAELSLQIILCLSKPDLSSPPCPPRVVSSVTPPCPPPRLSLSISVSKSALHRSVISSSVSGLHPGLSHDKLDSDLSCLILHLYRSILNSIFTSQRWSKNAA
jgi:hypothetical protein